MKENDGESLVETLREIQQKRDANIQAMATTKMTAMLMNKTTTATTTATTTNDDDTTGSQTTSSTLSTPRMSLLTILLAVVSLQRHFLDLLPPDVTQNALRLTLNQQTSFYGVEKAKTSEEENISVDTTPTVDQQQRQQLNRKISAPLPEIRVDQVN